MNVYIFGNSIVPEDNQSVKLLPDLKANFPKIHFIHADPTGNWWKGDKNLVIIDTVQGIDQVTVFTSFKELQASESLTVHDYDLYMDLKLMKKLGKIESFKIIGIPSLLSSASKNVKHKTYKGHKRGQSSQTQVKALLSEFQDDLLRNDKVTVRSRSDSGLSGQ